MNATCFYSRRTAGIFLLLVSQNLLVFPGITARGDDSFEQVIRPFLAQHCLKCHRVSDGENPTKKTSDQKPKGGIDLGLLKSGKDLVEQADLVVQIIDVLDSNDMPPETEPELPDTQRESMISLLKKKLAESELGTGNRVRIRRLNRFQYNYTVRDLFQLNRDVFSLPEKLMTRNSNYLHQAKRQMPPEVRVSSQALNPQPGMQGVKAFPKDLRAAHGFDNQSNQLTMSPLLLDAFLRLAVSIVESPDFNSGTVGIWQEFFEKPEGSPDLKPVIQQRLKKFLSLAFRRPVSNDVIDRYTDFVLLKIKTGLSFSAAMKKVASATLSSPFFLYRVQAEDIKQRTFELAENLSYLLWSSAPDQALLDLADRGELRNQEVLAETIDRMLQDPRIERFLDTFPAQWLQLENVLAATPDPKLQRYFSLEKDYPASLQMLIEPLLLFDSVFIENRPLQELIQPDFGYRSRFLNTWYTSNLKPRHIDTEAIIDQNKINDTTRNRLQASVQKAEQDLKSLLDPVRQEILAKKKSTAETGNPAAAIDEIKPLAAWEFDGDLKASVGNLDLSAKGKVQFDDGKVVLKKAYLLSPVIPVDLQAKTLEVWCIVHHLDMPGGGLMGIQGEGDFFDTIVIGERKPRHWISGSNGFSRTLDFNESAPEDKQGELIHLVMVYQPDGTTLLYRNGQPYGKPFKLGRAVFPKNKSRVIFGLRHLPPGGNKFLDVSIDRARLYDRALTADEAVALNRGSHFWVSDKELNAALNAEQIVQKEKLEKQISSGKAELKKVPANRDPNQVVQQERNRFDNEIRGQIRDSVFRRVKVEDPRYGGVITNAAIMSMTSGPKRSHPIARGAWVIEVIFNDPPPPPPNDVPPLNEEGGDQNLTIREKFRVHRENPDCAGCHSRLDPLGFALENYDLTGRWREKYRNGRDVDMSGKLLKRYPFQDVVEFKAAISKEKNRLAVAFTEHLLRFALERELSAKDRLAAEAIVKQTADTGHSIQATLKSVILSQAFQNPD